MIAFAIAAAVWTWEVTTNRFTDQKVFHGWTTVDRVQLSLTCADDEPSLMISSLGANIDKSAEIPWDAEGRRVVRLRFDNDPPLAGIVRRGVFSNAGSLTVVGPRFKLPKTRLLVGDLFFGSIVEFDFTGILSGDRSALAGKCGLE
jgi:hypothetical protein